MTSMTTGGRRKVHYTLPDETEVVEEYDIQTDELAVRKRRSKTVLGAYGEWFFEVGEPPARTTIENDMMRPSSSNPALVRKDRPHAFEWRIRNLPYPKPTYSVTIDINENQIVVRTTNKKYFKRIDVADMDRARLPLEEPALSWSHDNNTLIIQYKKPAAVLSAEKDAKVARLSAPEQQPQQDEQCKQQ
uniref:Protein DPCD n=1 Tax=Haptolina brevifila TaxID=156173 RepID=A0A7S2DN68_9EUKA|eukprot:CAMPEP_0174715256 /NCGR_PEP_ID=MMETSP1094-20130205/21022_1 /TAXON_ID=156173 /ORGANISM="Chrysochromulina brevifilum, Strain UTEX LB 985" /LENGTH=188 /DNA_ID=CAMNT_0015914797 /DNA_START=71 /DNA_END=637 /DNA_ORIENTATION=+